MHHRAYGTKLGGGEAKSMRERAIEVGSEMGNGAVFTVSYRFVHNYFYEFYIFMAGGPKLWMPPYCSTFFSASVQGDKRHIRHWRQRNYDSCVCAVAWTDTASGTGDSTGDVTRSSNPSRCVDVLPESFVDVRLAALAGVGSFVGEFLGANW